jgi:hypothetical protein
MSTYHARPPGRNADFAARLAKLIPRLASPHDGEIVATAHAIRRMLHTAGLDLHDLATVLTASIPIEDRPQDNWLAVTRWCRDHGQTLHDRERNFVEQMVSWCHWREPSEKQAAWLAAIAERLTSREARGS